MKKKYLLYSILLANMAALPAGAALSASADNVPTHDNVPGVNQKSIRDSLAYEAYLDSISRQFDLTEVVFTGTRTPKFLKDTPIQTRVIGSKDIAKLDATNVQDLLQQELPGVEFSYAMNQQTHLNFSGFGGQGVLFLVDGERLADCERCGFCPLRQQCHGRRHQYHHQEGQETLDAECERQTCQAQRAAIWCFLRTEQQALEQYVYGEFQPSG